MTEHNIEKSPPLENTNITITLWIYTVNKVLTNFISPLLFPYKFPPDNEYLTIRSGDEFTAQTQACSIPQWFTVGHKIYSSYQYKIYSCNTVCGPRYRVISLSATSREFLSSLPQLKWDFVSCFQSWPLTLPLPDVISDSDWWWKCRWFSTLDETTCFKVVHSIKMSSTLTSESWTEWSGFKR